MASKKYCDKCKAPANDFYTLECEYCGGSTFSHKNDERGSDNFVSQRKSTEGQQEVKDNYDPSIFEGLLDTSFNKYTTRKLASFTYRVALFVVGLIIFLCAVAVLWIIFNQNTTVHIFFAILLMIALVLLFALIWLASLRLRLESFTALVQIARNTQES
jgi:hypothetical protein